MNEVMYMSYHLHLCHTLFLSNCPLLLPILFFAFVYFYFPAVHFFYVFVYFYFPLNAKCFFLSNMFWQELAIDLDRKGFWINQCRFQTRLCCSSLFRFPCLYLPHQTFDKNLVMEQFCQWWDFKNDTWERGMLLLLLNKLEKQYMD